MINILYLIKHFFFKKQTIFFLVYLKNNCKIYRFNPYLDIGSMDVTGSRNLAHRRFFARVFTVRFTDHLTQRYTNKQGK